MPPISMTVLRAGYWNGEYPRAGDTITVDEEHAQTLELAGFAVRQNNGGEPMAEAGTAAPARFAKGSKHGR